eukprot:5416184-Pyramimonas_sp.AAC.1
MAQCNGTKCIAIEKQSGMHAIRSTSHATYDLLADAQRICFSANSIRKSSHPNTVLNGKEKRRALKRPE